MLGHVNMAKSELVGKGRQEEGGQEEKRNLKCDYVICTTDTTTRSETRFPWVGGCHVFLGLLTLITYLKSYLRMIRYLGAYCKVPSPYLVPKSRVRVPIIRYFILIGSEQLYLGV